MYWNLFFSDGNPPPPIHFNSTTTKLDKNSFCKVALIPFPTIQKGFSTPLPPQKKMCGPTHQLSFKIGQNCLCGPILSLLLPPKLAKVPSVNLYLTIPPHLAKIASVGLSFPLPPKLGKDDSVDLSLTIPPPKVA